MFPESDVSKYSMGILDLSMTYIIVTACLNATTSRKCPSVVDILQGLQFRYKFMSTKCQNMRPLPALWEVTS